MNSFYEKRTLGILNREWLAAIWIYVFFAYLYHFTLFANQYDAKPLDFKYLFSPLVMMKQSGLQYCVMFIFSIPVWWLIFRQFKFMKLGKRLLLHLITLPVWTMLCQKTFYFFSDLLEWGHLRGSGQVWDIYIPALFYMLQFGLLHAYEYYHTNQNNIKQKAALTEAALKSELSALKAQLNPHFLYNVFNTISASVPSENETTREMIAKLSDLFRYQLKATQTELVPLSDELDFVEKYLDLEKARFEDRLKVVINVPLDVMHEKVPPMILQPLVENSLKHGLSSLIEGGEIGIRIQRAGEKIQFEVSDTGVGVADKSKLFDVGVGLTNTKLRLEKMYGTQLKISDNLPRGLKIEFAI
ncbi:MAG: histidine kinase [Bacteroidota bacterium]